MAPSFGIFSQGTTLNAKGTKQPKPACLISPIWRVGPRRETLSRPAFSDLTLPQQIEGHCEQISGFKVYARESYSETSAL
ncbi:hypothetical protein LEMLEM_LOCUS6600 [Lemmus lemmus]